VTTAATRPAIPSEPVGFLVGGDRITASFRVFHEHVDPATGQPSQFVTRSLEVSGWTVGLSDRSITTRGCLAWLSTPTSARAPAQLGGPDR
jgi:hypothetical protein